MWESVGAGLQVELAAALGSALCQVQQGMVTQYRCRMAVGPRALGELLSNAVDNRG